MFNNNKGDNAMNNWEKRIQKLLLNKKIVRVEYMPKADAKQQGWSTQPIQIMLNDGTWLTPMQDDEGNDGGAISTNSDSLPTIPVNRL